MVILIFTKDLIDVKLMIKKTLKTSIVYIKYVKLF